jgi:hypothetical protein
MVGFEYNVYSHTSPSGKKYIGITKQKPEHRWSNGDGYKRHPYFYNAIKKHGWDKMEHVVLFTGLSEQEAKEKEINLIALYDTTNPKLGYNISIGGESGAKGLVHSEKTRRKLSMINKGKTMSEEAKLKIGIANKGKIVSKETRLKQSIANKGQTVSQETRKKLSEAMTGKQRPPCSEETRERLSKAMKGKSNREGKYMRKIACTNNETGEELKFDNISDALFYIKDNVYPSACKKSIYEYCRREINGYKHKWRYEGL